MRIQISSFLLLLLLALAMGISLDKFLTLSSQEKQRLDQFKQRVKSRMPHDYMREDAYLINFLRENDFNVAASEKMILDMLRWREENKIDDIINEDFSEFEEEYRGSIEGCDNEGRPVITMNAGDLDIRRAILQGKGEKLKRFTDRFYEEAVIMVRAMQKEGQNVTQVTLICDLNGFNLMTHACPSCIPIYFYILTSLQSHYPGYIHKFVTVNTPSYALPFYDVFKPVMSPKIVEILELFGKDKDTWQKYLFQEISPTQLSTHFGGIRTETLDSTDLARSKKVFRCDRPFWEYTYPGFK